MEARTRTGEDLITAIAERVAGAVHPPLRVPSGASRLDDAAVLHHDDAIDPGNRFWLLLDDQQRRVTQRIAYALAKARAAAGSRRGRPRRARTAEPGGAARARGAGDAIRPR